MSLPRIITTFVYPPIPIRTMDWQAHYDDDDDPTDGHQCATGHGRTETEAVIDLIENHPRYPDCERDLPRTLARRPLPDPRTQRAADAIDYQATTEDVIDFAALFPSEDAS